MYVDIPMDEFFNSGSGPASAGAPPTAASSPTATTWRGSPVCWPSRDHPLLILGTDVWADHAEDAALRLVEALGIPTLTNGMGRGLLPGGHPLLVTKARGAAINGADLVIVVGTPLDFRLGYGVFGGKDGRHRRAKVVHVADSPGQLSTHAELAASAAGDLSTVLDGLVVAVQGSARTPDWSGVGRRARRRRQGRRPRATTSC